MYQILVRVSSSRKTSSRSVAYEVFFMQSFHETAILPSFCMISSCESNFCLFSDFFGEYSSVTIFCLLLLRDCEEWEEWMSKRSHYERKSNYYSLWREEVLFQNFVCLSFCISKESSFDKKSSFAWKTIDFWIEFLCFFSDCVNLLSLLFSLCAYYRVICYSESFRFIFFDIRRNCWEIMYGSSCVDHFTVTAILAGINLCVSLRPYHLSCRISSKQHLLLSIVLSLLKMKGAKPVQQGTLLCLTILYRLLSLTEKKNSKI
jgi:hypothetical protein